MGKYITIQLPAEFVETVIDPVVAIPELGYSSRAELIKSAVREYVKQIAPDLNQKTD